MDVFGADSIAFFEPRDVTERNRRILVVDDNAAIHEDMRQILLRQPDTSQLDEAESLAFGEISVNKAPAVYNVDFASQGEEGFRLVVDACQRDERYAMAFVDMRMPPGWDGVETITKIWEIDPDIEIVICTAYSDHSWADIVARLGTTPRLLILKKPFDPIEVSQLACCLTEKWHMARALSQKLHEMAQVIDSRTQALERANERILQG